MMDKIIMEHGSGGRATGELIDKIFGDCFANDVLSAMEDAAVVDGSGRIAITTDSFVVTPMEFPGGDIGRLSVCGSVNDLLMRGAVPRYITSGFILEEGADIALLRRIVESMAKTAKEAGVIVVAGDTKVVEGNGGIYINTTGVGFVPDGVDIKASGARQGDAIIASGNMGDHHATILSARMGISNRIESDNAPLVEMVQNLLKSGVQVHVLRDVTRGGLGTVLKELSLASGHQFLVEETKIPVSNQVKDFCGLLGLDPLYMGNEGKLIAIVAKEDEEKALEIIRSARYGADACVIGQVLAPLGEGDATPQNSVIMKTRIGGKRVVDVLLGEGLPRIC